MMLVCWREVFLYNDLTSMCTVIEMIPTSTSDRSPERLACHREVMNSLWIIEKAGVQGTEKRMGRIGIF